MRTSTHPGHVVAVAVVATMSLAVAFSPRAPRYPCDHRGNDRLRSTSDGRGPAEAHGENSMDGADAARRRMRRRNLEHWGVERRLSSPSFPSTFDDVADDAFRAISGTVCGLQRPDPNVASNAMHRSVLDYRPTHPFSSSSRRWSDGDDGGVSVDDWTRKSRNTSARMGVEIDGAASLFQSPQGPTYLSEKTSDEGRAMRILSLLLAKRLSKLPWEKTEGTDRRDRSVAVYFNSVEQSLLATRELGCLAMDEENAYDCIQIYCLGQNEKSQSAMTVPIEKIILIVKPTDYDPNTFLPAHGDSRHQPRIQSNVVDKLQSLLFQASALSIPAVVLSPRLSELPPLQQVSQEYKRTGPSGFEQSGFQKSSTYGGIEPPVGPTSWLLRDLVPPVFVWVGCANTILQRKGPRWSLRSVAALFRDQHHDATSYYDAGDEITYSFYSSVALVQSAMDTGHSWHMFAVKERLRPRHSDFASSLAPSRKRLLDQVDRDVSYHYIGSSIASRGRPNTRLMNDAFEEFCSKSTT